MAQFLLLQPDVARTWKNTARCGNSLLGTCVTSHELINCIACVVSSGYQISCDKIHGVLPWEEQTCTGDEDRAVWISSNAASLEEKICRNRRIRTLFDRFQNGEYSLAGYIASVRHQTGLEEIYILLFFALLILTKNIRFFSRWSGGKWELNDSYPIPKL